jgi:hypothetical protein
MKEGKKEMGYPQSILLGYVKAGLRWGNLKERLGRLKRR